MYKLLEISFFNYDSDIDITGHHFSIIVSKGIIELKFILLVYQSISIKILHLSPNCLHVYTPSGP